MARTIEIEKERDDISFKRKLLPVKMRFSGFEVELTKQHTKQFYLFDNFTGIIQKVSQFGNLTVSLDTSQSMGGSPSVVSINQVSPYHAYTTKRDVAFFALTSLKVTVECLPVSPDEEIIMSETINNRQNIVYYLTSKGTLAFVGLRNNECQTMGKVRIEEKIENPIVVQYGFYMAVWPNRRSPRFHFYDLRCTIWHKLSRRCKPKTSNLRGQEPYCGRN